MTRAWWIDEASVLAGSRPAANDVSELRAAGFGLVVSLMPGPTALQGLSVYPIPIEEGGAPSLVQACEFAALIGAAMRSTKSLVFCDNGLGRSAFMGSIYWIAKGFTAADALARVTSRVGVGPVWHDARWDAVLHKFERLGWRFA